MEIFKTIKQNNSLSGIGSPVGVVTPEFINQIYLDTAAGTFYYSKGLTNADWSSFYANVISMVDSVLFYEYETILDTINGEII